MPFKTKFRKKRTKSNKKLTLRKVNKKVNQLIGSVETKYADTLLTWAGVDTITPTIHHNLTDIPQGLFHYNRVGAKVFLKKLKVKYQCRIGNSSITPNDSYNQMRIIMVKYQHNAAAPTPPTLDLILEHVDPAHPEITMLSPYKKNSEIKYKILHDRVVNCYWRNASGTTGGSQQLVKGKINLNLNHTMTYPLIGGGVGIEPAGFDYGLYLVSDSIAPTNPEFCATVRLTFTDA